MAVVVFLPKLQQFAGARGIVRAVQVQIRLDGEPFQTSGPIGAGDAALDRGIRNWKTAFREQASGDNSSKRVANLEAPGQPRREDKLFARMRERRDSAIQ